MQFNRLFSCINWIIRTIVVAVVKDKIAIDMQKMQSAKRI